MKKRRNSDYSRMRKVPAHLSKDDQQRLWDAIDGIFGLALEAQIILTARPCPPWSKGNPPKAGKEVAS